MKSLALRVLSDFGVDGIEPQALGSRKGRLALCLLALAGGQVVPADVLVDALWGDAPPAQPEDQLAVLISRLRSVLGRDRIQHRDRGYLLVCDWLDASELAALTEEMDRRLSAGNVLGAAAAARVALSLLRGYQQPPVPGDWAQLRLAELDRLVGRARRTAAAALLEAGDWMAAADAATAAVAADGYDETSLRVLLRAYVAGGRVAAALAAYAQARERLAAELGTDPSPQTVAGLPGRGTGLPRHRSRAGPRRPDRDRGRRRGGWHREDRPAPRLGRVPGRGGRHGPDGLVRAARPGHATGRSAVRAGRAAAPARARRCRRSAGSGRGDPHLAHGEQVHVMGRVRHAVLGPAQRVLHDVARAAVRVHREPAELTELPGIGEPARILRADRVGPRRVQPPVGHRRVQCRVVAPRVARRDGSGLDRVQEFLDR
jgi:DNA-binding SARP family transcriptional activator